GKLQRRPALREAILGCDLINADGQPVVWASRLLGRPLKERVAGIDLFSALVERCAVCGYRPYLLGARQDVVEKVAELLKPKVQLAGWRNGYWEDDGAVGAQIRQAKPDVLFVAMRSPEEENFLTRCKDALEV